MCIRDSMYLTKTIPVVVTGELPRRMTHRVVSVAPFGQPTVNVIFIRVDNSSFGDRSLDQGCDRHLFHILQHPDHDLARALDHAEDRRLFLGQRAATALPLQFAAASLSPFFFTASGLPLCPAVPWT